MEPTEFVLLMKISERLARVETQVVETTLTLARINAQLEALLGRRG